MIRVRFALVLALATVLAGCASGSDRAVLGHPIRSLDRPNGQPGWLPCMAGDALCSPPS